MHLWSFIVASVVVIAIPGPVFAYTVACALRADARDTLLNALGLALGGCFLVLASAAGFAQVFAHSHVAMGGMKALGCAYLVYLGCDAMRARRPAAAASPLSKAGSPFVQGLLVELTNPKALLFYLALLPQFAEPGAPHPGAQVMTLGAVFLVMQFAWDLVVMFGTRRLRDRFAPALGMWPSRLRVASGLVLVILGGVLFVSDGS